MVGIKDYIMIIVGLACYAFGFTAFILPHEVVIGGLSGVGTLVYFATGGRISVAITQYVCNLTLLAIAYRIVGRRFVLRTIFGATVIAIFIGVLENIFMSMKPLMNDISMSVILGGILAGIGIGLCFIHNGSSGGTDIVAAMVSKKSNVSIGRTMLFVDLTIVSMSIFLPFEGTLLERIEARVPLIVYGFIVTFIVAYVADMIIYSNRQSTQFIIFSTKWAEIADRINQDAHRGVTVFNAQGWYTKQDVKVLMVWCRKMERVTISRIIKSIDENAFISLANANGVYGRGFDTMPVKAIKNSQKPTSER